MGKSNLIFNSTELRSIASAMDSTVADFRKDLSRIDEVCTKLKQAWSGADANKYYSKVVERRNALSQVEQVIHVLPEQLREIATWLDEAESNLAGQ